MTQYNFTEDCSNFRYADYKIDPMLGAPTSVSSIPEGSVYGNTALFKKNILSMHQAITETKLWDKLDERNIALQIPEMLKINDCGHTGATMYNTLRHMVQIRKMGWDKWAKTFE